MSAKRSNEPIVWFLFGTGGFFAAFFLPIHILLYGILFPLGALHDPGYGPTFALLQNPLTRIYLFLLVTFCFFHAAHRMAVRSSAQLRRSGCSSGFPKLGTSCDCRFRSPHPIKGCGLSLFIAT
jgi:fumarate reductase subunit D